MLSNLNAITINCEADFSPNVTGIPTVLDNEDSDPSLNFRDESVPGCALIRWWTATDEAGNEATVSQSIRFTNSRAPTVTSPSSIAVACGSIEDASTNLAHNIITVQHPCSRPVTTNYTDSAPITQCGFTFSRVWVVQDDCGTYATFVQTIRVLNLQFPNSPENGLINARLNEPLLWPQFPGSSSYRVFVWIAAARRPTNPIALTYTRAFYPSVNYPPGTQMLWQIEYVTDENTTIPSPIWGFETIPYPDLQMAEVTVSSVAFSGQTFHVSWTVTNIGNLSTNSFVWYDYIFIGRTLNFDDSRYVRRVRQNRFVDVGDAYSSQAEINLNENDIGNFYAFVVVDYLRQVSFQMK